MKIPEIPGNYRPGDVVNGRVLTERGHWVEIDNARADGLVRRHLSTEVSTVRDSDKPSREIPGPSYSSSPYGDTSPTLAVPPQPPAPGTPSSAPGPHPRTRPDAPGGQVVPGSSAPAKRGCAGCLVAIVIAMAVIGLIVFALSTAASNLSAGESEATRAVAEEEDPAPEVSLPVVEAVPSYRLTADEEALLELTDWEVWSSEYSSHYLVTVAAPGLERAHVRISIEVDALDDDGVTHTFTDYLAIQHGEPTLAVGYFRNKLDAEIVDMTATFSASFVRDEVNDYRAWVEEASLDTGQLRPTVTATIAAEGGERPSSLRLTTVVRDEAGNILNLGVEHPSPPQPGSNKTVEYRLWGSEPVQGTDDFEFTFMQR